MANAASIEPQPVNVLSKARPFIFGLFLSTLIKSRPPTSIRIHASSAWLHPFDNSSTRIRPFHLLDGGQVHVPMMSETARLGYASGEGSRSRTCRTTAGDRLEALGTVE